MGNSVFVPMVMFPVPGRIGGTPLKTDPYQPVHESWERFGAVFSRVVTHYYDDVNHSRLMRAAIEGLLRELDSYSQYFDEDGLRHCARIRLVDSRGWASPSESRITIR